MEQTTDSDEARIEKIAGTPCDNIEREHGSTHSYKHGNECNRCRSRVNPAKMIPLHDDNGVKALTCPHCPATLIKLNRDT